MPTQGFLNVERFLRQQMRMSHLYQPVMIRTLLEQGGSATRRQIAAAFLAEDESQLEYYENITGRMPGPVLAKRGVVVKDGSAYSLAPAFSGLSESEVQDAIRACNDAIRAYKEKRGRAIWQHRAVGLGQMPGKLRYETLRRAGFRCELCGVPADERALDVDHIIPRKLGGEDVPENLQALCWKCNLDKGAGDTTDFREVRAAHAYRQPGCPFCELDEGQVQDRNTLALALPDRYPVTPLHTLVIPCRHVPDYFDLYRSEQRAMQLLVEAVREQVLSADPSVVGFNVGVNAGEVAGQTVSHCHIHVIPRRQGDVPDPRGGVRHVIPSKGNYL